MSSSTPVIFRVDTATYGHYCYDLCYLYSNSYCFRYLKSEENRISINFVLHLSAVVLMHGSRVKVPQKSTLHFKYVEMSRRSRHRTTTLHFKYVSCHEDQESRSRQSRRRSNQISTISVEEDQRELQLLFRRSQSRFRFRIVCCMFGSSYSDVVPICSSVNKWTARRSMHRLVRRPKLNRV